MFIRLTVALTVCIACKHFFLLLLQSHLLCFNFIYTFATTYERWNCYCKYHTQVDRRLSLCTCACVKIRDLRFNARIPLSVLCKGRARIPDESRKTWYLTARSEPMQA